MARGRLLKTKVREVKKLAEAEVLGFERGKIKLAKEFFTKGGLQKFLVEKVKSLSADSTIKLVGFGASAYLCYIVFKGTKSILTEITKHVSEIEATGHFTSFDPVAVFVAIWEIITGATPTKSIVTPILESVTEPILIALSLLAAFLIVEYGDKIIDAFGSLGGLGLALLKVVV